MNGTTLTRVPWAYAYWNYLPVSLNSVPWQATTFVVCLSAIIPLGLVGNVITFAVMTFSKMRRHPYCVYLAALAVSDFLNVVARLIFYINLVTVRITGSREIPIPTATGPWTCALTSYLYYTTTFLSTWIVVVISTDRFFALRFPLLYRRLGTRRLAVRITIATAVVTVVVSSYLLVPGVANIYVQPTGACLWSTRTDRAHVIFTTVVISHGPLSVVIFTNAAVAWSLREKKLFANGGAASGGGTGDLDRNRKLAVRRVTNLMLTVSITYIFCSTPGAILATIYTVKPDIPYVATAWEMFLLLWDVNYSVNIVFYLVTSREFREVCCSGCVWCRARASSNRRMVVGKQTSYNTSEEEMAVGGAGAVSGDTGLTVGGAGDYSNRYRTGQSDENRY
ncbi:galanin-like G-protein coupled receptor npr-9 [Tubulanus polymorphus]|uniref:galanin-like G-protein coupled receptor npr-9 n=1 Tax=Tubulanus polymorphus TaxID=672921 RepID=UPI003DA55F23